MYIHERDMLNLCKMIIQIVSIQALIRYNVGEFLLRVSPLSLDAHRKVSKTHVKDKDSLWSAITRSSHCYMLMLTVESQDSYWRQRLFVRYNVGKLSLRVSPLPLDAHRRVWRLMLKTMTPCKIQCIGDISHRESYPDECFLKASSLPLDTHKWVKT